jgi:hypothetical protein
LWTFQCRSKQVTKLRLIRGEFRLQRANLQLGLLPLRVRCATPLELTQLLTRGIQLHTQFRAFLKGLRQFPHHLLSHLSERNVGFVEFGLNNLDIRVVGQGRLDHLLKTLWKLGRARHVRHDWSSWRRQR